VTPRRDQRQGKYRGFSNKRQQKGLAKRNARDTVSKCPKRGRLDPSIAPRHRRSVALTVPPEGVPEAGLINPDNLVVLSSHLKCAAFELPIKDGEQFGKHDIARLCAYLAEDLQLLHHSGDCWHWVSDSYPADSVSLRAVTSDNFLVVDVTDDHRIIGEVDFPSALTTLHEKAIYLHDARQFQVEKLDYDGRKAYVRSVNCDYFTDAIDYTQVKHVMAEITGQAYKNPQPDEHLGA